MKNSDFCIEELIDESALGFLVLNSSGKVLYSNKKIRDMLKTTKSKIENSLITNVLKPFLNELQYKSLQLNLKSKSLLTLEFIVGKSKKTHKFLQVTLKPVNEKRKFKHFVVSAFDITSLKLKQQELEHLASYDALTQLPNRRAFNDSVTHTLARHKRENSHFALIYIDLDNFKKINDSLGHLAGDEVLRISAERLKDSSRTSDIVARIGGDEFAIILENVEDPTAVEIASRRLASSFSKPIHIDKKYETYVSVSIGAAIYPAAGKTLIALEKHADDALYLAKSKGRNTFQIYHKSGNKPKKAHR